MPIQFLSTLTLAFLLGLRHGIDWDHIAAITDITGATVYKKESFILGFLYALGHASVIIILGLAAVAVGVRLPSWVDQFMEPFVGITLIMLGVWLFYSILKHGKKFKFQSRWMLFFRFINKIIDTVHTKFAHKHHVPHVHFPEMYGKRTAFTVGIIHGIGAETPTQVVLFAAAAGAGGFFSGVFLVLTFVLGLLLSNTLIVLISTTGFLQAQQNSRLNVVLGLVTAVFSLTVGVMFLLHRSAYLPVILGG
jgi:high-affinity nickel-transport protein